MQSGVGPAAVQRLQRSSLQLLQTVARYRLGVVRPDGKGGCLLELDAAGLAACGCCTRQMHSCALVCKRFLPPWHCLHTPQHQHPGPVVRGTVQAGTPSPSLLHHSTACPSKAAPPNPLCLAPQLQHQGAVPQDCCRTAGHGGAQHSQAGAGHASAGWLAPSFEDVWATMVVWQECACHSQAGRRCVRVLRSALYAACAAGLEGQHVQQGTWQISLASSLPLSCGLSSD